MTCKCGDIVVAWFPHSNQQSFKRRPALVVQADNLATGLPQTVLAMITTNLTRLGHPSRVPLPQTWPDGTSSGLVADSVVMTDNLATVLNKAIDTVIGRLPDMSVVDAALRHTLAL